MPEGEGPRPKDTGIKEKGNGDKNEAPGQDEVKKRPEFTPEPIPRGAGGDWDSSDEEDEGEGYY